MKAGWRVEPGHGWMEVVFRNWGATRESVLVASATEVNLHTGQPFLGSAGVTVLSVAQMGDPGGSVRVRVHANWDHPISVRVNLIELPRNV